MSMNQSQIDKQLLQFPEWNYKDNAIHTTIKFPTFITCMEAMNIIAKYCTKQGHHPRWTNEYNVLEISLTTHDLGGVSPLDFLLAFTIDKEVRHLKI